MIYQIVDAIVKQLESDLSDYTTLNPDAYYKYFPTTRPTNTWIAVVPVDRGGAEFEVGQSLPTNFEYSINIVIGRNNADIDQGLEDLEVLERRVYKSIADQTTINSLRDTTDMDEQVLDFKVLGTSYSRINDNNLMLNTATIQTRVRVSLNA